MSSKSEQPLWSQNDSVSYEAAAELLNRVHGHLIAESQKGSGNIAKEIVNVRERINSLNPLDREGIADIREHYGPIVRAYFNQAQHGTDES